MDLSHAALEAYNGVRRRVSAQLSLPLYDIATQLAKSSLNFYEDVHLDEQGTQTVGNSLADLEASLVPTSHD